MRLGLGLRLLLAALPCGASQALACTPIPAATPPSEAELQESRRILEVRQAEDQERLWERAESVVIAHEVERVFTGTDPRRSAPFRVILQVDATLKGEGPAGALTYEPENYPGQCNADPYFDRDGDGRFLVFFPPGATGKIAPDQLLAVGGIKSERLRALAK